MSFSSEIKKELIQMEADEQALKAELAAIIRMNGLLSTNDGVTLDIQTESAAIARRIFKLIKAIISGPIEILVRKKMRLKKNNVYIVRVTVQTEALLEALNIEYEYDGFVQNELLETLANDISRRAYLRGAFIARGSINNPETSSYHLEIFNIDPDHNQLLCELMNMYDLKARELQRRNGYIVYIKEAEKIADFLSVVGATNALFKFEDARIVRDMRNSVNRIVNCETANLNKTISASVRQMESIKFIAQTIGLDALPERLKEIAEVRLQYPEIPLKELGELLPSGKLSKSGVNHRLKKIEAIARSLKEGKV